MKGLFDDSANSTRHTAALCVFHGQFGQFAVWPNVHGGYISLCVRYTHVQGYV